MSAITATRRGRRAAERLMVDRCQVVRVTGQPGATVDPVTGLRTPAPTATVYAGKCKVQTYEAHESAPDSGEHVFTVQRYTIHLPAGTDVRVDDQITVTSAVLDAGLVGRSYRVVALLHKSFATSHRVAVDEIV